MPRASAPAEEPRQGKMIVFVSDFRNGLRVFQDIWLIRVKSSDYSLLIMEDYFPVLGQVNGKIELMSEEGLTDLGRLRGFYVHRDNEFSLLIKEQLDEPAEAEAETQEEAE